jgi:hypothetical protein
MSYPSFVRQDEARSKKWYGLYNNEDQEVERVLARNADEAFAKLKAKSQDGFYVESTSAHAAMFD